MQGTEVILISQSEAKMRSVRTAVFSFVLIVCTCFLSSCDLSGYGTALYQILKKLKFRVVEISAASPARLDRYDVLFLRALDKAPTETEIRDIQDFVSTGGTLIVAGNNKALDSLFSAYGLELRELTDRIVFSQRISEVPLFPLHPVDDVRTGADFAIDAIGREVAVLYGSADDATIVTLRDGEGRAYFIASDYLFARSGLRHRGNAAFLYNLMSTLPRNARIGLAESRYYTRETKPPDPFIAFVFRTPGGLGAVYICLTLFIFFVLRGRRFGKPLDAQEINRRLSAEYVHAMTALYQKGNTRPEVLKHIRDRFKVDLGARWRVNPNLDTSTFLEALALRGAIDEDDELTELMAVLDMSMNISETRLLDIAQRVEAYREVAKIDRTKLAARRGF
ncbi:hypothetical protein C6503_03310 [Candidatus Poribacteria bacterium]|nr:MAG: hypothetical protein C6503_03310 [Candidatus Poribacteria bacterium]